MKPTKCKFVKNDGKRCKSTIAIFDDGYCLSHSQTKEAKEIRAEGKKTQAEKKKKTFKKITLSKRVTMKCLDCAGESRKEITLCHLFDCPLWAVRFGYSMQSKNYQKRMKTAEKYHSKDFEELKELGVKPEDFYIEHPISIKPK